MKTRLCAIGYILLLSARLWGQDKFLNLGFENPQRPFTPVAGDLRPQAVYASEAVPGWEVYFLSQPQQVIAYNTESVGGPVLALFDRDYSSSDFHVLDGNYSVRIFAGSGDVPGGGLGPVDVALAQNGLIPTEARSLRFMTSFFAPTYFQLALDGQTLSYQPLFSLPAGGVLYGADISSFAGSTAELRFTLLAPRPWGMWSETLDGIEFSPEPIPEPSGLALTLAGAGLFWWLGRGRQRREPRGKAAS